MKKYEFEVNGQKILVGIDVKVGRDKFKAIAFVNFGWFEVAGFRISHFEKYERREDRLCVEPPKFGAAYEEAFRTSVAITDEIERERARKQYWYKLEDAIIEAYYKTIKDE